MLSTIPMQCLVDSYTVNHINVKTPTLIAYSYFSTKGIIFTVNLCFSLQLATSHDGNIYHCDYHTFSIIAQH